MMCRRQRTKLMETFRAQDEIIKFYNNNPAINDNLLV